jgi:hypothetical protein
MRPHYELSEWTRNVSASFSPSSKAGTEAFALSTDDLILLIEQHAGSIDMYADYPASRLEGA